MPRLTKVLLADGRKMLREGLNLLLERHDDLRVVAEADDGWASVKLARAMAPHVVVLLSTAPGTREASDLVRALAGTARRTRVVVVTPQSNLAYVRGLLEAGAGACLTGESAANELVAAIRAVVAGRTYVSPPLAEALVTRYVLPSHPAGGARALTTREREILQHIAEGRATKEIARDLRVGPKTIETHRRRIMDKLDMHSVAELTKYAVLEGLTTLDARL